MSKKVHNLSSFKGSLRWNNNNLKTTTTTKAYCGINGEGSCPELVLAGTDGTCLGPEPLIEPVLLVEFHPPGGGGAGGRRLAVGLGGGSVPVDPGAVKPPEISLYLLKCKND